MAGGCLERHEGVVCGSVQLVYHSRSRSVLSAGSDRVPEPERRNETRATQPSLLAKTPFLRLDTMRGSRQGSRPDIRLIEALTLARRLLVSTQESSTRDRDPVFRGPPFPSRPLRLSICIAHGWSLRGAKYDQPLGNGDKK